MITVTIEKRYGVATIRAKVSAPTIERAVEIAGPGARVEFPIEVEAFFATQLGYPATTEAIDFGAMTNDQIETAVDAGLQGAYDTWLNRLMDQMDFIEKSCPQEQLA